MATKRFIDEIIEIADWGVRDWATSAFEGTKEYKDAVEEGLKKRKKDQIKKDQKNIDKARKKVAEDIIRKKKDDITANALQKKDDPIVLPLNFMN